MQYFEPAFLSFFCSKNFRFKISTESFISKGLLLTSLFFYWIRCKVERRQFFLNLHNPTVRSLVLPQPPTNGISRYLPFAICYYFAIFYHTPQSKRSSMFSLRFPPQRFKLVRASPLEPRIPEINPNTPMRFLLRLPSHLQPSASPHLKPLCILDPHSLSNLPPKKT